MVSFVCASCSQIDVGMIFACFFYFRLYSTVFECTFTNCLHYILCFHLDIDAIYSIIDLF